MKKKSEGIQEMMRYILMTEELVLSTINTCTSLNFITVSHVVHSVLVA